MKQPFNTRILVIDDEESIRNSFREILVPRRRDYSELREASAELFGDDTPRPAGSETFQAELHEAESGARGLDLVKEAVEEDRPYAVIFVDMRMPGWNGLETVQRIREHDSRAEVIFITAYSDYSIEDVVSKAGANVGYLTKPFAPEEIRQLSTKAIYEWNKTRGLEDLIHVISDLRATKAELDLLLHNILQQVADLVGSSSALLAVRNGDNYSKLIGIGTLADDESALRQLEGLTAVHTDQIHQGEDYIYFPMDRYGVFALFESDAGPLRKDRIYMVQLFIEQATQAIRNAELQEELLRHERLSAMGKGVSVVAHDLRSPLGNIVSLLELIEADYGADENLRSYLSMIRSSAESAGSIVNDILDFTRDTRVIGTPVSMGDILSRVDRDIRETATDSGVAVSYSDSETSLVLVADESKLQRVISNLVRNALEAIAEHCAAPTEHHVEVHARADGSDAVIEVVDDGPGLPAQLSGQLFVPFATGGARGTTGLGLPIVKQFVEAHEGTVDYRSSGEGTRFIIRLPERVQHARG